MKTMKILLIHTNGTSIDVDMSYKTLDDARAALKKAYDETKPCTFDTECENMSYCGENDALLYCDKTSVHVWKIVTTVPVLENVALNVKNWILRSIEMILAVMHRISLCIRQRTVC